MTNIVQFPHVGVEITAGTVSSCTIHDENGSRSVPEAIGKRRYFVDVLEAGGGRIEMWDGEDYRMALIAAEELRRDFGGRIRDTTGVLS